MRDGAADHLWLLVDLLGHEMPVLALVDETAADLRGDGGAVHDRIARIMEFGAVRTQHHPIAFVQIGDLVGEGRERKGV